MRFFLERDEFCCWRWPVRFPSNCTCPHTCEHTLAHPLASTWTFEIPPPLSSLLPPPPHPCVFLKEGRPDFFFFKSGLPTFLEVMGKVACFRPHSSVDRGWRIASVRCLLRAGLSLQPRFIPCCPRRPTLVFFLPLADTDVFHPCLDADIYFIKRKCTFNIYLRCSVRPLKLFCMLPCYSNHFMLYSRLWWFPVGVKIGICIS